MGFEDACCQKRPSGSRGPLINMIGVLASIDMKRFFSFGALVWHSEPKSAC